MSNRNSRKAAIIHRLKQRLKLQSQSLAEQFEFRMVVEFVLNDGKKEPLSYLTSEVVPVMTNNFESNVMDGVKKHLYSMKTGEDLLKMDVVQLHASGFYCLNQNRESHSSIATDVPLWPGNDIHHLQCLLFSRWKTDKDAPYKRIKQEFRFHSKDCNLQIMKQKDINEQPGAVLSNPEQTVFTYSVEQQTGNPQTARLSGLCLFLPQSNLLTWDTSVSEQYSVHRLPP
uniref:Uncharacterized protein n=1 Tax=Ciona savignyi TaxID=51511 RepID=H2Y7U2_CIOSA